MEWIVLLRNYRATDIGIFEENETIYVCSNEWNKEKRIKYFTNTDSPEKKGPLPKKKKKTMTISSSSESESDTEEEKKKKKRKKYVF